MTNIQVNQQYNYTIDTLGSFSGGTAPVGATVPHPVSVVTDNITLSSYTVTDLSAVTLGGINGLNN